MDRLGLLLTELWVVNVGSGAGRQVDHACLGDATRTMWLTTPTLGPRRVFYYRQRDGHGPAWGSHMRAFDFRTKRLSDRRMPYGTVAVTRDGGKTYYVRYARGAGAEWGVVIARA
jgi:hypothetical protein